MAINQMHYHVILEIGFSKDQERYHTYGLQAEETGSYGNNTLAVIHDVTTDFALAKHMAKMFNKHQLSMVHLYEAVEEAL